MHWNALRKPTAYNDYGTVSWNSPPDTLLALILNIAWENFSTIKLNMLAQTQQFPLPIWVGIFFAIAVAVFMVLRRRR